jgi:hypothetical protein
MDLESELKTIFTPDRAGWLVRAVRDAFEANREHYDPDIGHDRCAFGLLVYKSKCHFLEIAARQDSSVQPSSIRRNPSFSLRIGRFEISTYSASEMVGVDEAECFPNNRVRAPLLAAQNSNQLPLFLDDSQVSDQPIHVCLVHVGDPERGLDSIFLGVPNGVDERQRICSYAAKLELWSSGDELSAETPIVATEKISPEVIDAPVVRIRRSSLSGENKQ